MSTPAPTLDELPPQNGSILELHSIGEEYDGMLVEYQRIDKESGKFNVISLDGEKFMRVKKRCCKRPDIQPLQLRKLLLDLSQKIYNDANRFNEEGRSVEGHVTRLKSLLPKDQCCAPVLACLSCLVMIRGSNSTEEELEKAIRFLRRAIACYYGYDDILAEGWKTVQSYCLSSILQLANRFDSSVRAAKNFSGEEAEFSRKFFQAENLNSMGIALNDDSQRQEKCTVLMEAAELYIEVVGISMQNYNRLKSDSRVGSRMEMDMTKRCLDHLGCIMSFLDKDKLMDGSERSMKNCRRMLHLSTSVLKVCTDKDGVIRFLSKEDISFWTTAKNVITEEIEKAKSFDQLRAMFAGMAATNTSGSV